MGTYARSRARLLTAAVIALAALGAHTTAVADDGDRPVPVDRLVPGVPFGPVASRQVDTPDQGAPPRRIGMPAAEPQRSAAPAEDEDEDWVDPQLVEFVPAEDVERARKFQEERAAAEENEDPYYDQGDGENPEPGEYCTSFTGPYQREAEKRLRLPVNGSQSAADCAEIRRFQKSRGIVPATGFAGPTTWGYLRLDEATRKGPNASRRCPAPARGKRIVCIDLNRQLLWVQSSSTKVVFGPVAIRSGRKGYLTRTGRFSVYWRHKNHVSDIYDAPMPYSQFFSGGQAMHATPGSVYKAPGSHGCINLSNRNARLLWNVLKIQEAVYVWGAKPAT
ncbi:L,D-transpeptidase family protein [Actinacidiphila glaucinigra]|uniref:L,D-transpeptidase family protein n=1 Tax=Actinacidiphila glaucinigra TaxID=235986 RepID=UPI003710EF9F